MHFNVVLADDDTGMDPVQVESTKILHKHVQNLQDHHFHAGILTENIQFHQRLV